MRLLVLLLSLGSVVSYGRALGEFGGYLLGRGNLLVVGGGMLGGTLSGVGAIWFWRRYVVPEENAAKSSEAPPRKRLPRQ